MLDVTFILDLSIREHEDEIARLRGEIERLRAAKRALTTSDPPAEARQDGRQRRIRRPLATVQARRGRVLDVFAGRERLTTTQAAERVGLPTKMVLSDLLALAEAGRLTKVGKDEQNHTWIFELPELDRVLLGETRTGSEDPSPSRREEQPETA